MSNYKILWFDDEHQTLETVKEEALENDIELIGFSNAKSGIKELEENFIQYQAVIVDGLFFDESEHDEIDKSGSAFGKVALFLKDLKKTGKVIPWFILSGQPSFVKEKNTLVDLLSDPDFNNGKIYDKNNDEDIVKLFSDLKTEADKIDITKIRYKYADPFQCFGTSYLDIKYENLLLNIIMVLENEKLANQEDLLFNPCRILLERVFEKINEVDEVVLPYALLNFDDQRVGLANCSKYLSGLTVIIRVGRESIEYKRRKYWEEHISQQVQTIIGICHPASHDIQKYSSYTFKSVLWAIFDVLIWLKLFIDQHK